MTNYTDSVQTLMQLAEKATALAAQRVGHAHAQEEVIAELFEELLELAARVYALEQKT